MKRKLMMLCAFVLIFGAGLFGGRGASALMSWINTPAPVSVGEYSAVLRNAGADLVLFSLSTCPYCREARAWLDAHDVRFKELVIDTSPEAQRLFDELKEKAVPVLVSRDRLIRGFAPDTYAATQPLTAASQSAAAGETPGRH